MRNTPTDPAALGLLRGTVPPGFVIPMHAHAEPEPFYVLSGQVDGLAVDESGPQWRSVEVGQIFHVPGNARHAFRNSGPEAAVTLIITTPSIVRFFEIIGTPVTDVDPTLPPSPEAVERFLAESAARGYWNASPEENAAVGITLPPAPVG